MRPCVSATFARTMLASTGSSATVRGRVVPFANSGVNPRCARAGAEHARAARPTTIRRFVAIASLLEFRAQRPEPCDHDRSILGLGHRAYVRQILFGGL